MKCQTCGCDPCVIDQARALGTTPEIERFYLACYDCKDTKTEVSSEVDTRQITLF